MYLRMSLMELQFDSYLSNLLFTFTVSVIKLVVSFFKHIYPTTATKTECLYLKDIPGTVLNHCGKKFIFLLILNIYRI